jgi:hypothetical protein
LLIYFQRVILKVINSKEKLMAKTKKNPKSEKYFMPLAYSSVLLLAVILALLVGVLKQADVISKYELIEKIDNQACRYLNGQPTVNGSFDLNATAKQNDPKLVYECKNGQSASARNIQGKNIGEYELGAKVMYFATNEEAEKYAEDNINPLRYWGVDEEGQQNGIPQTSEFTFIVTDEDVPYFDAYTVKSNAVLRVSLPCRNSSQTEDGITDCQDEARSVLQNELKGINAL